MKKILLLLCIVEVVASCGNNDYELKKSIFVNDDEYSGLPKYSELGYNTFGAYYDRQPFISNKKLPVKVIVTNGETSFTLYGEKGNFNEMFIAFKIRDFLPKDYTELIALNGTTINLKDSNHDVIIKNEAGEFKSQILNGTIEFKRVQNVLVDTKQFEVILSGTFEFQALVNGEPVTISNGRFDVGVGNDNFFNL